MFLIWQAVTHIISISLSIFISIKSKKEEKSNFLVFGFPRQSVAHARAISIHRKEQQVHTMWKHSVEMWKHTKLEANTQLHSGNRIRNNNRRRKTQKCYKTYEEIDIHTNQLKKCQQKMKQIPRGQLAKRSTCLFFNNRYMKFGPRTLEST